MPQACVRFGLLCGALLTSWLAVAAEPQRVEVLLKGGTLHDGSGGNPVVGDVAISKGKIVGVGTVMNVDADWVLDCKGLVVCPGFIDLHNHSDRDILKPETRANLNFLTQGCTTVVTGNCGSGPVDAKDYYDKVDQLGAGTNIAHLLPQGSLRQQVLEMSARKPSDSELNRMRELADKAMRDGVWGMSSGLIYVPSSYATTDEIASIAEVVGRHGGIYASHIRGEGSGLLQSVDEAIEIGKRGHTPVHISHFKASESANWGLVRQAVARIQKAREAGLKVTADQYPYNASSTSLDATLLPTWALEGGRDAMLKRLDDPEQGPRIRKVVADKLQRSADGTALRIARFTPRPKWTGKNLVQIAEAENKSAIDIAYEVFRNGGAQIVHFSMSEDDVRFVMAVDWVATASDGRAFIPGADQPHPRSYGTFTRKLGYYALNENVVSLSQAIRSATSLPAEILGMSDRGLLKAGLVADIAVFDPSEVSDTATFDEPHRYSRGVKFVFVNGQPAIIHGAPTGGLFGKALRRTTTAK